MEYVVDAEDVIDVQDLVDLIVGDDVAQVGDRSDTGNEDRSNTAGSSCSSRPAEASSAGSDAFHSSSSVQRRDNAASSPSPNAHEDEIAASSSSGSNPEDASSGGDGFQASSRQQHSAALPSSSMCWGAVLKGDGGTGCELSGFCSGKNHFKSKFCAACIESIEIPSSRVRALRPEMQGLFANSQRSGFWKTAPDSVGGGEMRIANNTITCDGPWLIIYKNEPPAHGLVQWEPMPAGWVDPVTLMVRVSVAKGTLVPSCEMWRHAAGRKHAAVGSSSGSEVQSWAERAQSTDARPKGSAVAARGPALAAVAAERRRRRGRRRERRQGRERQRRRWRRGRRALSLLAVGTAATADGIICHSVRHFCCRPTAHNPSQHLP